MWSGGYMESAEFIKTVFDKFAEEKKTGELLPITKDFYKKAEERSTVTVEDGPEAKKTKENTLKTLQALKTRRLQKLLVYLAYDRRPPLQLTEEETEIYSKIKKLIEEKSEKQKTIKIKILYKIPEIINPKGGKMGPYEPNQIIECTEGEEAAFLVNNKIGEAIT